jgi:hypothetical protein
MSEYTIAVSLFVPSDRAVESLTMKTWNELQGTSSGAFEKWLQHHRVNRQFLKKDFISLDPKEIEMMDDKREPILTEGDYLKVGGKLVMLPDVIWKKRAIHVLDGELLYAPVHSIFCGIKCA